jgi:CheY-like chemotaxis protein
VVNGQEVVEALERQPYDIIFMDVKMPIMNGIQAAMEIRKRWPENGPKIIAVTAYALHGDKEKCLAAGMDDYIPKPVQKEDLAGVLNKYRSSKDSP